MDKKTGTSDVAASRRWQLPGRSKAVPRRRWLVQLLLVLWMLAVAVVFWTVQIGPGYYWAQARSPAAAGFIDTVRSLFVRPYVF